MRKRLQRVEELPTADQRAVLKFVDAHVDSRGVKNSSQKKEPGPRRDRAFLPLLCLAGRSFAPQAGTQPIHQRAQQCFG
jgi:hypothetical protein